MLHRRQYGPYDVVDPLGRGGMGSVYRARHRESGAEVALKTVTLAAPYLLHGLRREIAALARLQHPGIVRIVSEGVDGGVPWYAMELLAGETLRMWGRRIRCGAVPSSPAGDRSQTEVLPSGPRDFWATERLDGSGAEPAPARFDPPPGTLGEAELAELLGAISGVCGALAYLHGEGIVHRDLKPENVVVRPDGRPVLVDFGMAVVGAPGREALETRWETAGTVWYMAPEQIRGEVLDARADLYALGCVLYELLTGRPPFDGETLLMVMSRHEADAPAPPSTHVAGIPAALDALVMQLLAKAPRDRLGHAADVARALRQLGARDRSPEGPAPRPYLYRPGLCGREAALSALDRSLAGLGRQAGGILVVTGGDGVGKTRFAMEAAGRALRSGVTVVSSPPASSKVAASLSGLRGLLLHLADRCRERGPDAAARLLGRGGLVLSRFEPSLAPLAPAGSEEVQADLPPKEGLARIVAHLGHALLALSEDEPIMVVVDDLHAADALTRDVLRGLARLPALSRRRVLLLVTAADQESSGLPEAVAVVSLRVLEPACVGRMASDMLALRNVPPALASSLAEHSEGNPYLVAECLRVAVDEGLLFRDGQGEWRAVEGSLEDLPLPSSVRDMVGRRVASLSAAARALLHAAAVLRDPLPQDVLLAIAELPDDAAFAGLAELLTRGVLEESAPGAYRFVHRKVRRHAYESLDAAARRERHQKAAVSLAAREEGEHLPALAWHWEMAGETDRAASAYLAAKRMAKGAYDHAGAERLLRAYLALPGLSARDRVLARLELADDIGMAGRSEQAMAEVHLALAESRAAGDRDGEAGAMVSLANQHRLRGELSEAVVLCDGAVALSRELGATHTEARSLMLRALLAGDRTEDVDPTQMFVAARDAYVRAGDQAGAANALSMLAGQRYCDGDVPGARRLYEEALASARAVDARRVATLILLNLGGTFLVEERYDEALETFTATLEGMRSLGDRQGEGMALANCGICRAELGQHEKACDELEASIAILGDAGYRPQQAFAMVSLAAMHRRRCRAEAGRSLAERAAEVGAELGDRRLQSLARSELGRFEAAQGRLQEGAALLGDAAANMRVLDAGGPLGDVLLDLADVRLSLGEVEETWALLLEADAVARKFPHREYHASVYRAQARWKRLVEGDLTACEDLLRRARELVAPLEGRGQSPLAVEEGLLLLARGRDASAALEAARADLPGNVDLAAALVAVARLEEAVAAAASGRELAAGEAVDSLPAALRAALGRA